MCARWCAFFWQRGAHKARGTALGGTPASVAGSSPRHEAEISSSFDFLKKLQLDLTYRYVSSLPAQNVPSYATGDVRFDWRFHRNLDLSITGRNLFQPYHIEYVSDPGGSIAIVRNLFATVTWTSGK